MAAEPPPFEAAPEAVVEEAAEPTPQLVEEAPVPVEREVPEMAPEAVEPIEEVAAAPPPLLSEEVKEKIEEAGEEIAKAAGLSSIPEELLQLIVDKIEKIAWEVIPQIAEAVVTERIEKLEKGKKE